MKSSRAKIRYAEMLNQDDAERALATMRVMLGSGDPELVRMATEFGIYSPNPEVQREALRGFLMSEPRLEVRFDGSEADGNFANDMQTYYDVLPNADGLAVWTVQITGFDPEDECFLMDRPDTRLSPCLIRIGPRSVAVNPANEWSSAQIEPDGWLASTVSLNQSNAVGVRILVTP